MPADAPPSHRLTACGRRTAPGRRASPAEGVQRASNRTRRRFYSLLAQDSMAQIERHTPLDGRQIADVGGGGGYFTAAFRERGAQCLLVEPDAAELYSNGIPGRASVIGDGYWLPLADASVDVCFSCNVLEHVKDPAGFIDEMIRVTRPGRAGLPLLHHLAVALGRP